MSRNYIIIQERKHRFIIRFQKNSLVNSYINHELYTELKDLLNTNNTIVALELNNIEMLGEKDFDSLNLLARLAKKSGSRIMLNNVSQRMQELIDLIKSYTVFEVDYLRQGTV